MFFRQADDGIKQIMHFTLNCVALQNYINKYKSFENEEQIVPGNMKTQRDLSL